ncbi:hypothetical protein Fot_55089 [Forsythia ovata]|uniref:Uncharacterized protein n=1 Tax=Forsythia ovata TaxID=205694 RepID=A0ABD1P8S7_9LAMI
MVAREEKNNWFSSGFLGEAWGVDLQNRIGDDMKNDRVGFGREMVQISKERSGPNGMSAKIINLPLYTLARAGKFWRLQFCGRNASDLTASIDLSVLQERLINMINLKRGQVVTIERLSLSISNHPGRKKGQMARQSHTPIWFLQNELGGDANLRIRFGELE